MNRSEDKAPRILVVDDEKDQLEIYAIYLNEVGFQVDEASNGSEADFMTTKVEYDLILTDMEMPYMNGVELIKSVRNGPLNRSTPFVVASGKLDKQMVMKLLNLKVSKILTKPVVAAELINSIASEIGFIQKTQKPKASAVKDKDEEQDDEMEVAC